MTKANTNLLLPIASKPEETPAPAPTVQVSNPSCKLFIVDDDRMVLKLLRRHFQRLDDQYDVRVFTNAEACLAALDERPDVIVCDYQLSDSGEGMDGLSALQKIKLLQPEVQVIMLSSQMEVRVAVDCLKKGAVNYIVKDDIMQFNIQKAIEDIVKSNTLKEEIYQLSHTIKRDKIMIRGYGMIIFFLALGLYYIWGF